ILGATLMPHSLYLGSDLVKARLRDYNLRHTSFPNPLSVNNTSEGAGEADVTQCTSTTSVDEDFKMYRPSIHAMKSCLSFSIWEVAISLFTFALFVQQHHPYRRRRLTVKPPPGRDGQRRSLYDS